MNRYICSIFILNFLIFITSGVNANCINGLNINVLMGYVLVDAARHNPRHSHHRGTPSSLSSKCDCPSTVSCECPSTDTGGQFCGSQMSK